MQRSGELSCGPASAFRFAIRANRDATTVIAVTLYGLCNGVPHARISRPRQEGQRSDQIDRCSIAATLPDSGYLLLARVPAVVRRILDATGLGHDRLRLEP